MCCSIATGFGLLSSMVVERNRRGRRQACRNPFSRRRLARIRTARDLELGAIVRVWWFHRSISAMITIIIALLSFIFLALQDRQYTAEALVKLTEVPRHLLRVGQQTVIDPRQNPSIATRIVTISSRSFLRKVAEKAELFSDPEFAGDQRVASIRWHWPISSLLTGVWRRAETMRDKTTPAGSELTPSKCRC